MLVIAIHLVLTRMGYFRMTGVLELFLDTGFFDIFVELLEQFTYFSLEDFYVVFDLFQSFFSCTHVLCLVLLPEGYSAIPCPKWQTSCTPMVICALESL